MPRVPLTVIDHSTPLNPSTSIVGLPGLSSRPRASPRHCAISIHFHSAQSGSRVLDHDPSILSRLSVTSAAQRNRRYQLPVGCSIAQTDEDMPDKKQDEDAQLSRVWLIRLSLAGWLAIETMRSCAEKPQTSNGDNGQIPRDVVEYVPLGWGKGIPPPVPAWCAYPSRAVWIDNLPPLRLEPGDNYRRPVVLLAEVWSRSLRPPLVFR